MERKSNPMCRSGCGFYGNPATDGLCSACYKDSMRKKQQAPDGSTTVSVPRRQPSPTFNPAVTRPSAASPAVQSLQQQQHNEIKRKRNEENTAKYSSEPASNAGSLASSQPAEEDQDKKDDKDLKKKTNRCAECRKKLGLIAVICRCGDFYCAVHRYSDKHNCTFDYQQQGAQEIRRNNPVVIAEKIRKI